MLLSEKPKKPRSFKEKALIIKHLSLSTYFRYILAILTAAALFITAAGLSPATAADNPPPTEIDAAQTATTTVEDTTAISETDAGAVGLKLPGILTNQAQVSLTEVPEEYLEATEETPLVNTTLAHGAISSYETVTGAQTLIRIDSHQAAKEYRFPLELPERATAELTEDGSILIKDANGEILGGYKTPWAIDTNGTHVPTRFTLNGGTLIQRVDFTEQTAFPVVADPNSWWGWVKCAGAIGGLIGANGLVVTKVAKIGGVVKLAKKLVSAGSDAERWWTLVAIAGHIGGIDNVIKQCR